MLMRRATEGLRRQDTKTPTMSRHHASPAFLGGDLKESR
jgi:hypothetical protein